MYSITMTTINKLLVSKFSSVYNIIAITFSLMQAETENVEHSPLHDYLSYEKQNAEKY